MMPCPLMAHADVVRLGGERLALTGDVKPRRGSRNRIGAAWGTRRREQDGGCRNRR
jgi:hypothetical protein